MSRPDPPVREDSRCAVCLRRRHPKRSQRYAAGAADLDPFCSVECCRRFHGCQLPTLPLTGRTAGRRGPLMHGTETGYSRGCRCRDCTTAATDAQRRRRRRRKEAAA